MFLAIKQTPNHLDPLNFHDEFLYLDSSFSGGLHYYVVMALLASYLMFVNILLLNLLIAIFSNTYANIENESG